MHLQGGVALSGLEELAPIFFSAAIGEAFVLIDGGGTNLPGDWSFGGFMVKHGNQVTAISETCTHLGCSVIWVSGPKQYRCPCHGSEYSVLGDVVHGPAIAPLDHFAWKQGPNGELLVWGVQTPHTPTG